MFEAFKEIVDFACSSNCANLGVFFWVNVLRAPASSSRHVQLRFDGQSKLSALGLGLGGGF